MATPDTQAGTLADLVAVPIGTTALVFLRPRYRLSSEQMKRLSGDLQRAKKKGAIPDGISIIVIEGDMDVIVAGDAEIKRGVTIEPTKGL